MSQALIEAGHSAVSYHAGLKRDERNARQTAFMDGKVDVIVATSAFGMGIDKPDVRFVVHYDVSDSLDAYYQEIGRAGRDGEPAQAILFFSDQDIERPPTGAAYLNRTTLDLRAEIDAAGEGQARIVEANRERIDKLQNDAKLQLAASTTKS